MLITLSKLLLCNMENVQNCVQGKLMIVSTAMPSAMCDHLHCIWLPHKGFSKLPFDLNSAQEFTQTTAKALEYNQHKATAVTQRDELDCVGSFSRMYHLQKVYRYPWYRFIVQ